MAVPWLRILRAVIGVSDIALSPARGRAGGEEDERLVPGTRALGQLETRLASVVVAALQEAFDRDSRRLELEREQPAVISGVVALNVAREKVVRERAVAAHFREARFGVRDRVRMIDVAFTAAARLAVHTPHRAHVVVQRDFSIRSIAQRQIERQCDRAAE